MADIKAPKKAIILAGGEGTRLRPLTYEIPKPLVPVLGKPMLEYIIEELERNGVEEIILSIGYKAEKIQKHFDAKQGAFKARIRYSIEKERLGTGGAIKLALSTMRIKEDMIVVNGDNLFRMDFKEMYSTHRRNKALATIAVFDVPDVTGSGVVVLEGDKVVSFIEKPDPSKARSRTISTGIYIIDKDIGEQLPEKEAFSFEREFLHEYAKKGRIYAQRMEMFLTVNDMRQYKEAEEELKRGYGKSNNAY